MNKKTLGNLVLIAVGIVFLGSLTSDFLGLGTYEGLGTWQTLALIIGLVLLGAGFLLARSAD